MASRRICGNPAHPSCNRPNPTRRATVGERPVKEDCTHLTLPGIDHRAPTPAAEWFPADPYRWAPGPQLLSVQPDPDGASGRGQLWIPVEPA